MRTPKRSVLLLVGLAASVLACGGEDAGAECARGGELCECYPNRTCDSGLICSGSDICVEDEDGSGGSGGNSEDGGSGGSGDDGGSGGSGDNGGSSNSGGSDTGDSAGAGASGSGGSSGANGDATSDAGGASTTGEDSTSNAGGATSVTNGGAGGTSGAGSDSGGTGGDAASASGGSGGTTDTTSTSTSGGSGGTTGETRTDLVPVDGWVDGSTNDVGIQGSWYTYDDGSATVVPADEPFFEGMGSEICISGTTVPDEYSGVYWGVAVGMDFSVVDETTYAYDATANGVAGIQLTLTGSLPPGIQLNLTMTTSGEGDTYCTRYTGITTSSRTVSVYFDEAQYQCWLGGTFAPIDSTLLKTFSVQVMSEAYQSVPFDFCVEDVSAILE